MWERTWGPTRGGSGGWCNGARSTTLQARAITHAEDIVAARSAYQAFLVKWRKLVPQVARSFERGLGVSSGLLVLLDAAVRARAAVR